MLTITDNHLQIMVSSFAYLHDIVLILYNQFKRDDEIMVGKSVTVAVDKVKSISVL